jgi:hypothetical protein
MVGECLVRLQQASGTPNSNCGGKAKIFTARLECVKALLELWYAPVGQRVPFASVSRPTMQSTGRLQSALRAVRSRPVTFNVMPRAEPGARDNHLLTRNMEESCQ